MFIFSLCLGQLGTEWSYGSIMKTLDCCCQRASFTRWTSWFQYASRVLERSAGFCLQFHPPTSVQNKMAARCPGPTKAPKVFHFRAQTCVCGYGFLFKLNNQASTKERICRFLNFVVSYAVIKFLLTWRILNIFILFFCQGRTFIC